MDAIHNVQIHVIRHVLIPVLIHVAIYALHLVKILV